jgi:hypothetical protein
MLQTTIATNSRYNSARVRSRTVIWRRDWRWFAVVAIVAMYAATVTPGHVFSQDDFAAYLMQAANLVEGRPYTAINYMPNPEALGFAPTHGYPPVYPLILAPVYKFRGFDLRALKIVTVLCFGVFLAAFVWLFEAELAFWVCGIAVLVVGCNVVFWEQRDYLMSEFPYLMFSFAALVVAQKIYQDLDTQEWRLGAAVLLSLLIYYAYGTRTIGIVLLPALVLGDVCKFRRPSRFVMVTVLLTLTLILLQTLVFVSPKSYVDAVHLSVASTWHNALYYGRTLFYVWRNGVSKGIGIAFGLLFTGLAAAQFLKRLLVRRSMVEFYLLGYIAVLIAWSTKMGIRGLLPILPFYFVFGLKEFVHVSERFERGRRIALTSTLFAFMAVTYLGAIWGSVRQEHALNVTDPAAQQLFDFLKATTTAEDVLVFQEPRTLALFTKRTTTMLAPNETPAQSARFFAAIHARVLVESQVAEDPIQEFVASKYVATVPVFRNSAFQVFLINPGQ